MGDIFPHTDSPNNIHSVLTSHVENIVKLEKNKPVKP